VLTELREKVGTRESVGQEGNYESVTTPDNSGTVSAYEALQMSRQ